MNSLPLFCAVAIIWNNSRLKSSAVGILRPSVGQILAPKIKTGTLRPRPGPEIQSAGIAPATVAGIALIRSQAAWAIEIATAIIFSLWIVASKWRFPM
jgi:hypothetical protein